MRYIVSAPILDGFAVNQDSAAKAVKKADELLGSGLENVTITDTKTGRKYRHEEFPSIVEDE